jgi:hypothetical protein
MRCYQTPEAVWDGAAVVDRNLVLSAYNGVWGKTGRCVAWGTVSDV